ncbi:MAG: hypothetical protein Kow00108_12480 [Calditrichia bacterium]
MNRNQLIITGIISGCIMGLCLFIAGAIFSRIIYGPQMAPPGKFDPEELNAWYFIWTKVIIGIFFGLLFTFVYEKIPLTRRINGFFSGAKLGLFTWLCINLWEISHPLIYGSIDRDRIFWLLYSVSGFIMLGGMMGVFYRKFQPTSAQ